LIDGAEDARNVAFIISVDGIDLPDCDPHVRMILALISNLAEPRRLPVVPTLGFLSPFSLWEKGRG
jgi:hypothetical protein